MRRALLGLIIVAALIVVVPWQGALDRLGDAAALPPVPAAPPTVDVALALLSNGLFWRVEPDYSLFLVRNVEFATRPHWHLVTAYGPWAFLFRGYHPANYVWLVLAWLALAVLTVLLLRDEPIVSATIVLVLAADPRPGLLLVFPLIVYAKRKSRLALAGVAAMALLGLVKSSALTLGLIVVVAMGSPMAAAVYVVSFLAFWLIAGQDASWLWPFLRGTWHVASAYGEAEGVGGGMSWSAALLLVVALVVIVWRRKEAPALILILFAFAKTALVRNDPFHAALWPMAILALVLLYTPRWSAIAAIAIIAPYLPAPGELGRQVVAMANPVAAKRNSDALYARDLAAIRARVPRPPVEGSVDVYGNWQSVAIAHGLDYRPRPVFQSYIAYDAALAEMNAEHLREAPPQSILFAINFTDRRYPALDDALSWPEILTKYAPVAASRDFLALRRAQPRVLRVVATRTLRGRIGEPLAIPPAALVWAEIHVETTMLGKLLAFAYRLPELTLSVDGVEGRFIRRTASAGFLLWPIVTQPWDFATPSVSEGPGRTGGAPPAPPGLSLTLGVTGGGAFYQRDFTVTLKELRVE